jgi:hypothetical protein
MPHLRLHLPQAPNNALVLGVGASRGKNEAHEGLAFYRLDCELSLEHVFDGGLRVRGFGGLGFASRGSTDGELGIAVGYALWPNPVVPPESSWSIGHWYGWQGLALDGAAATIVYAYRNDYDGRKLSTRAGAAFFVVGGPTVHIAHRKYAKAAASLGLRTVVPLLLYVLLAGKGGSSGEPGIGAGFPLVAGVVIAALIDDLALAW